MFPYRFFRLFLDYGFQFLHIRFSSFPGKFAFTAIPFEKFLCLCFRSIMSEELYQGFTHVTNIFVRVVLFCSSQFLGIDIQFDLFGKPRVGDLLQLYPGIFHVFFRGSDSSFIRLRFSLGYVLEHPVERDILTLRFSVILQVLHQVPHVLVLVPERQRRFTFFCPGVHLLRGSQPAFHPSCRHPGMFFGQDRRLGYTGPVVLQFRLDLFLPAVNQVFRDSIQFRLNSITDRFDLGQSHLFKGRLTRDLFLDLHKLTVRDTSFVPDSLDPPDIGFDRVP